MLGHSDNYIEANALSTPSHIVPEWYFLPFYAILRSIPNKLGGVVSMFAAIVFLLFLPNILNITKILVKSEIILNTTQKEFFKQMFWFFIFLSLFLGWLGAKPVETPFIYLGQQSTITYFSLVFAGYTLIALELEERAVSFYNKINSYY